METDTKIDVLLGLTAAVQQLESIGTTRLQSFTKSIQEQALLVETPSCTDQQRVQWTKAARELLASLSRQMSSSEVLAKEQHLASLTSRCSLGRACCRSASVNRHVA